MFSLRGPGDRLVHRVDFTVSTLERHRQAVVHGRRAAYKLTPTTYIENTTFIIGEVKSTKKKEKRKWIYSLVNMEAGRDRIKQLEGYYGRRGKIIENKDNSGIKKGRKGPYITNGKAERKKASKFKWCQREA